MKQVRLIFFTIILATLFVGANSCRKDYFNDDPGTTRISKIKLTWERKFHDYWVIADIDYVKDKISSIKLNQNSRNSDQVIISKFEYKNETFSRNDYSLEQISGKETFTFSGSKLIQWLAENNVNDQFVPLEEIQYEYENANLTSYTHYIGETLWPFEQKRFSYEGAKIKNLKAYYNNQPYYLNTVQYDLNYEGMYTYQDTNLLNIDLKYYMPVVNCRFTFVYEGSRIAKIIKQIVDNPAEQLINLFEFTYDKSGRMVKINYNSGIENSENAASYAEWDFEYENGKSNIKFDVDKILWKITEIDASLFPEKIINDFFTIYPE
jgi:hypothetical protein